MRKERQKNSMIGKNRPILGLHEYVEFITDHKTEKFLAKIDTGAARSSVDYDIVEKLKLGPHFKKVKVKSALGHQERPVIKARIKIKGIIVDTTFSISRRHHLKRKVLIGVNTLKEINALVDSTKDIEE